MSTVYPYVALVLGPSSDHNASSRLSIIDLRRAEPALRALFNMRDPHFHLWLDLMGEIRHCGHDGQPLAHVDFRVSLPSSAIVIAGFGLDDTERWLAREVDPRLGRAPASWREWGVEVGGDDAPSSVLGEAAWRAPEVGFCLPFLLSDPLPAVGHAGRDAGEIVILSDYESMAFVQSPGGRTADATPLVSALVHGVMAEDWMHVAHEFAGEG